MSSEPAKGTNAGVPSEMRISKQWDFAFEQVVTKVSLGGLIAGLSSIVLFRGRTARVGLTMFGMGLGAGDAFRVASIDFEKEKSKK